MMEDWNLIQKAEAFVNAAVDVVQTNRAKAGFLVGFAVGVGMMVLL